MSLTLLWDGVTHYFESQATPRGSAHYNAVADTRLHPHIHVLRIGILGAVPRAPALLKIARDADEIAALEKEAGLYAGPLKDLCGKYVPGYYGIYHGEVEGAPVACMLLEYCTGGKLPSEERNRKVMLAACAVHAAGIMHCDLLSPGGHNFIMSGQDVKIVDFSTAVPHRCYSGTPTLHPGRGGDAADGCRELMALEKAYGVYSGAAIPAANPFVVNPFAEGNSLHVLARRMAGMMMPQ
ncbi:hypothetical protein FB451DRAFT_1551519 [Mycena latifolia]|nr:hypothetical protein FB451DRAFT_1551519 [Mycena latifolia]